METDATRLVLITPKAFDPKVFAPVLADTLAAGDCASVILDLADADDEAWGAAATTLGPIAQSAGAAFLVHNRPDLAASANADGVHVTGNAAALAAAQDACKPDLIVGAGDCTTRHAAMLLGEHGPDYVLLGRLDAEDDIAATHNLVEWWCELFQIPCIALCAEDWETVDTIVDGGADFIGLRDLVWQNPGGPAEAVRRALAIAGRRHERAA